MSLSMAKEKALGKREPRGSPSQSSNQKENEAPLPGNPLEISLKLGIRLERANRIIDKGSIVGVVGLPNKLDPRRVRVIIELVKKLDHLGLIKNREIFHLVFHLGSFSMAEAVVSSVIGDMVNRAISLVVGHTADRLGTEAKIGRVRYMLIKIESVVEEAKGRQITNHGTLEWLSELIDGMYQGLYLLDLSGNRSIKLIDDDDDTNKVLTHPGPFLFSSSNPAKRLRVAASTIKSLFSQDNCLEEINNVVENLQSMSNDLKEFMTLLGSCPPLRMPVSTNLYVDCQMFGRHVEMERVINFLLYRRNPSVMKLDVLPIIGHIGVGKTTLVQHVCDDPRVRNRFAPIMLFDFFSLCREKSSSETMVTLRSRYITGHLGNFSESLQVLKQKLYKKRFLIVFEDVDSHNKQMLQALLSHLNCGKQGSKIIVTGNNNQILKIGTMQPIKLRALPHAEYWFYFKKVAFPGADFEDSCPRAVAVGEVIAKKLKGSFWGAKIIGSLLRAHPSYKFWRMALKNSNIWDLPVLGSSLPYISEVANYFLSRNLTMCHVNAYTSRPDSTERTLSRLQDVCVGSPNIDEDKLLDDHGNSLNLHVLLCKSILPSCCVDYVAHCHLGMKDGWPCAPGYNPFSREKKWVKDGCESSK